MTRNPGKKALKAADIRETPRALFDKLNQEFRFTLDAAATHENALCPHYFSERGRYARTYDGRSFSIHELDSMGRRLSIVARSEAPEGLRPVRDVSQREENPTPDPSSCLYLDERGHSAGYVRVPYVRHTQLCESVPPVPGDLFGQHEGLFSEGASGRPLHNRAPKRRAEVPRAPGETGRECEASSGRTTGLTGTWAGQVVFSNPPFTELLEWTNKAHGECDAPLIVMLVPANRTDQPWWQKNVAPYIGQESFTVRWLDHRTKFTVDGGKPILNAKGREGSPSFACALLIWS